jgi:hypothetical protein
MLSLEISSSAKQAPVGTVKFVAKFEGKKTVILYVDPYQYNVRMNAILAAGEEAFAKKKPFTINFGPLYTCKVSGKALYSHKNFTDYLVRNQDTFRLIRFHMLIARDIKMTKVISLPEPCVKAYRLCDASLKRGQPQEPRRRLG